MNIRKASHLPVMALVLAGGASLMAQVVTGSLSGAVMDEARKPIAGARISFESSALFQPRVYTTGANGEYRAVLLPVGNYLIKVSAPGRLGKTASSVRVGLGSNLSMDFFLKSVQVSSATVEVVSNVTAEAKSDDKVSINYSAAELIKLPVGLNFESIVNMTPGVTGWATDASVRGSQKGQISYRIDGMNVKDSTNKSTTLFAPLPDTVEDVQVVLSALNARNGGVNGGQINMVTKTGSNTFEGSIRAYATRNSWQANFPYADAGNNSARTSEDFSHYTDVTASGPILKDRLWFSVGARFQPSTAKTYQLSYTAEGRLVNGGNTTIIPWDTVRSGIGPYSLRPMATYGLNAGVDSRVFAGPGGGYTTNLEDAGTIGHASTRYNKIEGKLTGAINADHILFLTILSQSTKEGGSMGEHSSDPWMMMDADMVGNLTTKVDAYTLGWNGSLGSNWSVEARVNLATKKAEDVPNPNPGVSVMGYFASQLPNMMLHQLDGMAHTWVQWEDGYRWGTVENRLSTYNQAEKTGNSGFSVNAKGFLDFAGKHELDIGAERAATVYNFGRTKEGNRAVFQGGWYLNATTGSYLYPVFRRGAPGTTPTEILTAGTGETGWPGLSPWNDQFVHWSDAMRGPSAHMEKFWNSPADSTNSTTSFWVNDVWTIDSRWSVLGGIRFNRLTMQDQGGVELDASSLVEPRLQVKFNPDGQNKEIYSLSAAKLASAYSDQMANEFRGNEWEVRTVHLWSGAGLAATQPGFDTAAALTDAPTGTYNGYTYTGANMFGVRFVDYAALTNASNYAPSFDFVDARQTYSAKNLKAPYALEFNLGYQRNYDSGYFKLNLVRRLYKDDIVGPVRGYGMDYLVHMVSPDPSDPSRMYKGAGYWINSENTREFNSLEYTFSKKFSARWNVSGGYTWDRTTGTNDMDYYNFQNLQKALLTPAQQVAAVGKGVLNRNQVGHLFVTYVRPVGAGNISFSIKADSWLGGMGSLNGRASYESLAGWSGVQLPGTLNGERLIAIDTRPTNAAGTSSANLWYNSYVGGMNAYNTGVDYYQVGMKIQWDVPIGLVKTHLIGYVSIDNIFNHMLLTHTLGFFDQQVSGGVSGNSWEGTIPGRAYANNSGGTYGSTYNTGGNRFNDYNNGNGGRKVGDFSIGLRF
jgi:hypothetical protein